MTTRKVEVVMTTRNVTTCDGPGCGKTITSLKKGEHTNAEWLVIELHAGLRTPEVGSEKTRTILNESLDCCSEACARAVLAKVSGSLTWEK